MEKDENGYTKVSKEEYYEEDPKTAKPKVAFNKPAAEEKKQ